MTRLWLAAILGVLLGVGIAYTSTIPVASPANTLDFPLQPIEVQRKLGETNRPVQQNSQLTLISLLTGILVAVPFFLLTKRRS